MAEPFSLLLPVYAGDHADQLRRAIESSTVEQQLVPDQLVIVQDGPVGPELASELARMADEVTLVPLPSNVGLGRALQAGLGHCRHEIVARVDADDVSRPERFAVQVPMVAGGLDIVGSAMEEFTTEDEQDGSGPIRARPVTAAEIRRYAVRHNPFNHPTVVYRRSAVEAAGGYRDMPLMEDYWLFARMIMRGANMANVPEALVRYRVGDNLYERRGGLRALRSDLTFQRQARQIGLTTTDQMLRNLAERTVYRLVPPQVRAWGYRRFVGPR